MRTLPAASALGAAFLFGASTPAAKTLVGDVHPVLLAGLLYAGSGLGLGLWFLASGRKAALRRADVPWLLGAVLCGGIVGPVLLMIGLATTGAASASLMLNLEGVFTALLAWFAFRENFDRRIALGMALIVAGAALLSWPAEAGFEASLPALSVLGACLAWALDNNLTRKVSLADAGLIAMLKGLAAGTINLALAVTIGGAGMPEWSVVLAAAVLGFASYGLSLVLFVIGLRHLGTARTAAYFSTAPFAGAILSIPLLGEAVTPPLAAAGALMAWGVWLHLTEHHEHAHTHVALEHEHEHEHDAHHQHEHPYPVAPGVRHTHAHHHDPITHTHPHYPDAHHRHEH